MTQGNCSYEIKIPGFDVCGCALPLSKTDTELGLRRLLQSMFIYGKKS